MAKRHVNGALGVTKGDLPTKTCAACARPFTWRKKWRAVWEEVRYCSDACRGGGKMKSSSS